MDCKEFQDRISDMFDSGACADDMLRHVENCDECRRLYEQYANTVDMLTPHHAPTSMRAWTRPRKLSFRRRIMRYAVGIIAVAVVAAAGVAVYDHPAASVSAASVQAFEKAEAAMSVADGFSVELMVRTLPYDNFSTISIDRPFVMHLLQSGVADGKRVWRLDKGNGQIHVVCDGQAQYRWSDYYRKAIVTPLSYNMVENFRMFLNPEELMSCEKKNVDDSRGDSYHIAKTDSTTTLTIKSAPVYKEHPAFSESVSLLNMENIREYTFDARTNRLKSIRYWAVTDGKRMLILESRDFRYVILAKSTIVDIPKDGHDWIDLRKRPDIPTERLNTLRRENAEDAATRIMSAIFERRLDDAKEALRTYDDSLLLRNWTGYRLIGCKKVFESDGYNGVHAELEVADSKNQTKNIIVAIYRDPESRIWIADGGL